MNDRIVGLNLIVDRGLYGVSLRLHLGLIWRFRVCHRLCVFVRSFQLDSSNTKVVRAAPFYYRNEQQLRGMREKVCVRGPK